MQLFNVIKKINHSHFSGPERDIVVSTLLQPPDLFPVRGSHKGWVDPGTVWNPKLRPLANTPKDIIYTVGLMLDLRLSTNHGQ